MRNTACPGCLHPHTDVTGPNSRACPECGDSWNTAGEGYVSGQVEEKITTCWYKEGLGNDWKTGFFHKWDTNWEAVNGAGPGQYSVAIIEDATDSRVHVVYAGFVSFSPECPDAPEDEPKEPLYESSLSKAAREFGAKQEEGWIGKALERANEASEASIEKPMRFTPRLEWIGEYSRWLVQVHPETIEVFNDETDFLCQVKWVDGEMVYMQGGLPLAEIEDMFMEANK